MDIYCTENSSNYLFMYYIMLLVSHQPAHSPSLSVYLSDPISHSSERDSSCYSRPRDPQPPEPGRAPLRQFQDVSQLGFISCYPVLQLLFFSAIDHDEEDHLWTLSSIVAS